MALFCLAIAGKIECDRHKRGGEEGIVDGMMYCAKHKAFTKKNRFGDGEELKPKEERSCIRCGGAFDAAQHKSMSWFDLNELLLGFCFRGNETDLKRMLDAMKAGSVQLSLDRYIDTAIRNRKPSLVKVFISYGGVPTQSNMKIAKMLREAECIKLLRDAGVPDEKCDKRRVILVSPAHEVF